MPSTYAASDESKDITDYATYRRIINGCKVAAQELDCSPIEIEQLWLGSATPGEIPADGSDRISRQRPTP